MNKENIPYVIVSLISVFLASVSQVLLKKASQKNYKTFIQQYLNPLVIFAYLLFFGTTLLAVWTYKGMPISLGSVLESTAYIYITFFSVLIFKEKITARKIISLIIIVLGVLIFALG